jgi:dipeptide/tripeptide permease
MIAMLGHVILTVSALPSVIQRPTVAVAIFCIGMLALGTGTGGFKASERTLPIYIQTLLMQTLRHITTHC